MKNLTALSLAAALLCTGGVAFADDYTIAQQKIIDRSNQQFDAKRIYANDAKRCGTAIKAKIHWKSFIAEVQKEIDGKERRSFNGYCEEPLSIVANMCRSSDAAKKSIAKKLKSYECRYGGKGKRKMSFKGGKLTMWVDWDGKNNWDYIKKFIGNHL